MAVLASLSMLSNCKGFFAEEQWRSVSMSNQYIKMAFT
jgi:hypothetical protein